MLQRWAEFIREVDPDILTGYNIQNFDLAYLLNRAQHFKINEFAFLGRMRNSRSTVREAMMQSRQMGKRENKIINISGRVTFDLLQVNLDANTFALVRDKFLVKLCDMV